MKRISLIILSVAAVLVGSVSCQKINIRPDNPVIPQDRVATFDVDGTLMCEIIKMRKEWWTIYGPQVKRN